MKRKNWPKITNDDLDLDSFEAFLLDSFRNIASVSRSNSPIYVFHGIGRPGLRIAFERAFLEAGFSLSCTIIWGKQVASMGWGDYREQCEPILYGWIGQHRRKIKSRTETTLWRIDREGNYLHPTQKPVALIARAARNSTIRGERIFDPFAGSGTVFIAAEKLQRIAFGIEIEPKNCEICLKRWEEYTRSKAVLLRKIGKPQKRARHFDSKPRSKAKIPR